MLIPVPARRVFRLGLTTALSLAVAYGIDLAVPYLAPIFAFMLTQAPKPPMGPKGLIGLSLAVAILTSSGLILIPFLEYAPITGLLLVLVGLFLANQITLKRSKGAVGMLLVVGLTFITAMGTLAFALGVLMVQSLVIGLAVAIVCQWVVYPFFPEVEVPSESAPKALQPTASTWLAVRATLIVFPAYLLALSNPTAYLPLILKSISLGQQGSISNAKHAVREVLGSTLMGGCMAIAFWFALKLQPNLWMFFLWMLFFSLLVAAKIYRSSPSAQSPSFWASAMITMIILLGPAVADSVNGKDPYAAFAVRMSLFVAVTLYALFAIRLLDYCRIRFTHSAPEPLLKENLI